MANDCNQYDTVEPVYLALGERDVDPHLSYDEIADTLILSLYGSIGQAINEPLQGGLVYLRIEPDSHRRWIADRGIRPQIPPTATGIFGLVTDC